VNANSTLFDMHQEERPWHGTVALRRVIPGAVRAATIGRVPMKRLQPSIGDEVNLSTVLDEKRIPE
jgi:hypothetical protein